MALKGEDEYLEDHARRVMAEDIILCIDDYSDAFQPDEDQSHFIQYLMGVYARATSEMHATANKMDDKQIAWEEYALATDTLRRLRRATTHTH
jgi:hypothetical protein